MQNIAADLQKPARQAHGCRNSHVSQIPRQEQSGGAGATGGERMTTGGNWVCYRAVFAAEAPVHIGWHSLGLIERTRYYIPARAMWGAVVAAMAPRMYGASGVPGMYEEMKREVNESVRFTCFFAAGGADAEMWRPQYGEDGLRYGSLPAADFESRFVFSQTSAALNPVTFSALDGALHESEYLWFTDRAGTRGALHFAGYLIFRDSLAAALRGALERVSIGAERNYGWGRLKLVSFDKTSRLFGEFELVSGSGGEPLIESKPDAFLPAHLAYRVGEPDLLGDLEMVGGRDWVGDGSGRGLPELTLCWAPGSRVTKGGARFEIGERGVWKYCDGAGGVRPASG